MKLSKKRLLVASRVGVASASALAVVAGSWPGNAAAETFNSAAATASWNTAANWTPATIPNATDATANIDNTLTAAQTVNLDGTKTVGTMTFGTTAAFVRTLAAGSGGTLTFDVSTGSASLATVGNSAHVISAPITLNDPLNVTHAGTGVFTFSGVIAGGAANSFTKLGAGTIVLSGTNTYAGSTIIDSGLLQINSNAALGSAPVVEMTLGGAAAKRFIVNGGVTTNAAVNIGLTGTGTSVTGTTGAGLIAQTGTGQSRINGTVTIGAAASAGGHFTGGGSGNELVFGGAINTVSTYTGGFSQRLNRVIYLGGGNATGTFTLTGTALIGATNGLPMAMNAVVGASEVASLDLATLGFNQTLGGVGLGAVTSTFVGTLNIGAQTLTLNGNLSTITGTTVSASHAINATTGGISFGSTVRDIAVLDSQSPDDIVFSGGNIFGTGANKTGAGTMVGRGLNVAGALNVNAGTIATSTAIGTDTGTLSTGSLAFGSGTQSVRLKIGSDVINGGLVTTSGGTTTFNLTQAGTLIAPGNYNLINYTGATPGTNGFALAPLPGRLLGGLVDTGSAIALNVTGNDSITFTGAVNSTIDINTTQNFKLTTSSTATGFLQGDSVIFDDSANPANTTLSGTAVTINPSQLTFANTTAVPYTINSGITIGGAGGLNKTGNGTLTLKNANAFGGPTTIGAGLLEIDHATGSLTASSGVTIAGGATLRLSNTVNGNITFSRNLTGTGTIVIDPVAGGTAGSRDVVLTGNNTGFTGTIQLAPSGTQATNGSFRLGNAQVAQTAVGGATIIVNDRAQLFGGNLNNNITITGAGFNETSGGTRATAIAGVANANPVTLPVLSTDGIGAMRLVNGTTMSGNITLNGTAKLGSYNSATASSTTTLSGNVGITNQSDLLVIGGSNKTTASQAVIFTGTNTFRDFWVNGGSNAASGAAFDILQVGNNGTTGTLGSNPFTGTLYAQAFRGADLRFFRSDGYTLSAGQNIVGVGAATGDLVRTRVEVNVAGTGLALNGANIDLSDGINGGLLQVALLNNNAVLSVNNGSTVDVGNLQIAEASGFGGTVNQAAGSTVNVINQIRVGHFPNNTSSYNLAGGTLSVTAASPATTPFSAAEQNGGIYVGIDGTGVLNHTGGTLSTNFIVLDNRGDTGAGLNMPDGIDRYNLSGVTSVLNLKSTYGLIASNASTAVSLGGGTIRVDNTGSGTGTGANINVALNAVLDTVNGSTTTLDTNGAGNAFTLNRDVRGTGTLAMTGGGTINLNNTANPQTVSATLSGSNAIAKLGTGTTTWTGNAAGATGPVTISEGRLNLPSNLSSAVTVADGAGVGGEPTTTLSSLTLGATTGSTVFFDPNTAGALSTTSLIVNGVNSLDATAVPVGAGPFTAINYATKSGGGSFVVANAASYRSMPSVIDTGSAINVSVAAGLGLTWTGATSGAWDINTTENFTDGTNPQKFFTADAVTFGDGPTNIAVAPAGVVAPSSITVNAATNNYTFTSTAGNQIGGTTGITKTGASTLTLNGPNVYSGVTSVGGGTVAFNGTASLGNGAVGNNIAISGGGRLSHTAAAALDLGVNRNIAVGAGGGSISHNSTTAATITIAGNLTGSGTNNLSFHTNNTGSGTFALTGDNSGFTGTMSVDAQSTAATAVRINKWDPLESTCRHASLSIL